jgi:hypothetical protein
VFQWNWSNAQSHPQSTGIVETIGCSEFVLVLRRRFWPLGHVSCLGPLRLHPRSTCMSLDPL